MNKGASIIIRIIHLKVGAEILSLSPIAVDLIGVRLLFRGYLLFEICTFCLIVNDSERSILILHKQSLIMKISHLTMKLAGCLHVCLHLSQLRLKLIQLLHIIHQCRLL